jgi:hypothetical protein
MGRITFTRSGLFKHYFPVGVFETNEKEILQVLSQEMARRILMFIVHCGPMSSCLYCSRSHIQNGLSLSRCNSWDCSGLIVMIVLALEDL